MRAFRIGGIGLAISACLVVGVWKQVAAHGQQNPRSQNPDAGQHSSDNLEVPPERKSVTHHEITLAGKTLKYTATVGTLTICDKDDRPYGQMSYVAYTLDGAEAKSRPVSFLYNGGPGSSSIELQMGSFSPVRVQTDSPKPTGGPPFQLVPNQDTLLEKSDLVFIDAPLSGYSRAVGKGTPDDFTPVEKDVTAFYHFIIRFISVNHRWNSPKFLFGESYGTMRSAVLAEQLGANAVQLNGIVLISTTLSPGEDGREMEYIGTLPSYAAAAWYFNKVRDKPKDIGTWIQQAREFASGPYAHALFQGYNLPAAELDSVAQRMSYFTGLSVQYVKEANLRVPSYHFQKELLRDQGLTLGFFDMRFEGEDAEGASDSPEYDPSFTSFLGAYVGAFHNYLETELNYDSPEPYRLGAFGGTAAPTAGYGAEALGNAMKRNPHLKVFAAAGYFDLSTPFFRADYEFSHVNLPRNLRKNVEFGYYPSGHMIYLNTDALHDLKADLSKFIDEATKE